MKLLVGLGNPSPSYFLNRHNIGHLLLDRLATNYGSTPFKTKGKSLITDAMIQGTKCLLLKPMNFMNNSGTSVAQIAQFYKIALEDIIVFHDDLDLPFLTVRSKIGGGSGGHNGLRSIDSHLGKDYYRVRIGIDHPGHKDLVTSHVLGNFNQKEIEALPCILKAISDELSVILEGKPDLFQKRIADALKTSS